MMSAPAVTTLRTSSPRRAKSADRMLGAMRKVVMSLGWQEKDALFYAARRDSTGFAVVFSRAVLACGADLRCNGGLTIYNRQFCIERLRFYQALRNLDGHLRIYCVGQNSVPAGSVGPGAHQFCVYLFNHDQEQRHGGGAADLAPLGHHRRQQSCGRSARTGRGRPSAAAATRRAFRRSEE